MGPEGRPFSYQITCNAIRKKPFLLDGVKTVYILTPIDVFINFGKVGIAVKMQLAKIDY